MHLLFKRRPKAVGVCWQSLYGQRSILTVPRPFSWVGGALIGRPTGFLCSTGGFYPRYIPRSEMKPLRLFRDSAVNLAGRIDRRDRKRTERVGNGWDNVFSYKKCHWTLFRGQHSFSGCRRAIRSDRRARCVTKLPAETGKGPSGLEMAGITFSHIKMSIKLVRGSPVHFGKSAGNRVGRIDRRV